MNSNQVLRNAVRMLLELNVPKLPYVATDAIKMLKSLEQTAYKKLKNDDIRGFIGMLRSTLAPIKIYLVYTWSTVHGGEIKAKNQESTVFLDWTMIKNLQLAPDYWEFRARWQMFSNYIRNVIVHELTHNWQANSAKKGNIDAFWDSKDSRYYRDRTELAAIASETARAAIDAGLTWNSLKKTKNMVNTLMLVNQSFNDAYTAIHLDPYLNDKQKKTLKNFLLRRVGVWLQSQTP